MSERKKWIKSKLRKPEQGKKILCFHKGDIDIRQRFSDYWLPIPYTDSKFATFEEPEMWQEIDFPDGFQGYLQICVEDTLYNSDNLQKKYPTLYSELVKIFKSKSLNQGEKNGI
jgi:hypothetical protein